MHLRLGLLQGEAAHAQAASAWGTTHAGAGRSILLAERLAHSPEAQQCH